MFRCFLNLLKHNTFSSEILHSRNGIFVTAIKCRSTQPSFDSLNDEQKEKIIKAEVYLMYSLGSRCPDPETLTPEQWQHIFQLGSQYQRKKFCRYLYSKSVHQTEARETRAKYKEERKLIRQQVIVERETNPHINYGLGSNSMFPRLTKKTMHKWQDLKQHRSKLHGQPLLIDCSFDTQMTDKERRSVAVKLEKSISLNRKHALPFDLHMCGINTDSSIIQTLYKKMPNLKYPSTPLTISTECYTNLFPNERLVMLTSDSDNVLEYNANDIYIVGGIVDLGRNQQLTLAKAKSQNIRMARLPLEYIKFGPGAGKELPFSTVIEIMLERQRTSNWREILEKCVPLQRQAKHQHLFEKERILKNFR